MSFLSIKDLSFSYKDDDGKLLAQAIDSVSLEIQKGEYVVVVGANGSGKSTLSRLICGFLPVQTGSISGDAYIPDETVTRADFLRSGGSVPQGIVFQNPQTQIVAGTVFRDASFGPENLNLSESEINTRIQKVLSLTELDSIVNQSTETLSSGQKQKLVFAGILALQPDLLVLDEAVSMVDPDCRAKILEFVSEWHKSGKTIINVTHDFEEVQKAERVVFLEKGRIAFDGDCADFIKESTFFTNFLPQGKTKNSNNSPLSLVVKSVTFAYGTRQIFENLTLGFKSGSLTAVVGKSGTGKTTLFELCSGVQIPNTGNVYSQKRPVLARQNCEDAIFEIFAADDVAYGAMMQGFSGKELKTRVKNAMNQVGLPFDEFADRPVTALSGGEKRKLSIAGILVLDSDVIFFDEPSSGLDPQSRKELFTLFQNLCEVGKTIVFSTHRNEEAEFADRIIRISGDGQITDTAPVSVVPSDIENLNDLKPFEDARILSNLKIKTQEENKKTNFMHRLPPVVKYLLLTVFLCVGIGAQSIHVLLADCALCIVHSCLALYPVKRLLKNFVTILPYILLFFLFQMLFFPVKAGDIVYWQKAFFSVTDAKLLLGLRTILHYVAVLIPISVFMYYTDEIQILDGMRDFLKPLALLKIPTQHAVLVTCIIFRFMSVLVEETELIVKSQMIRSGGNTGRKEIRFFARLRLMLPIFVPLIVQTLKRAELLAEALEARYYN